MKSGWTCHILHHPLWPLPHRSESGMENAITNFEPRHHPCAPEACVKAITIECPPFNTCETFPYLIYFQGQPADLICEINRMFSDVPTHTQTHKLTTCQRRWLSVCLSKPMHCLCRPTFIYRSKELISIWLKGLWIAFCTAKFLAAPFAFSSPHYLFLYFSCSEED